MLASCRWQTPSQLSFLIDHPALKFTHICRQKKKKKPLILLSVHLFCFEVCPVIFISKDKGALNVPRALSIRTLPSTTESRRTQRAEN